MEFRPVVWNRRLGQDAWHCRIWAHRPRRGPACGRIRMRVIYNSTTRAPTDVERELNAEYLPRDQVLEQADFLSLHVPLRADTRGLIGPRNSRR